MQVTLIDKATGISAQFCGVSSLTTTTASGSGARLWVIDWIGQPYRVRKDSVIIIYTQEETTDPVSGQVITSAAPDDSNDEDMR